MLRRKREAGDRIRLHQVLGAILSIAREQHVFIDVEQTEVVTELRSPSVGSFALRKPCSPQQHTVNPHTAACPLPAQKSAAKAENAAQNGGKVSCTDCRKDLKSVKSEKGVPTPKNQAQVHHDPAIKNGGGKDSKPVVLCPECHVKRHE